MIRGDGCKGDYHGNLHNYLDRVEHNRADN